MKSLRKAQLSGGPAQRSAKKVKEMLGGINLGERTPLRTRTTDHGETRPRIVKYKLDELQAGNTSE